MDAAEGFQGSILNSNSSSQNEVSIASKHASQLQPTPNRSTFLDPTHLIPERYASILVPVTIPFHPPNLLPVLTDLRVFHRHERPESPGMVLSDIVLLPESKSLRDVLDRVHEKIPILPPRLSTANWPHLRVCQSNDLQCPPIQLGLRVPPAFREPLLYRCEIMPECEGDGDGFAFFFNECLEIAVGLEELGSGFVQPRPAQKSVVVEGFIGWLEERLEE